MYNIYILIHTSLSLSVHTTKREWMPIPFHAVTVKSTYKNRRKLLRNRSILKRLISFVTYNLSPSLIFIASQIAQNRIIHQCPGFL